MKEKLKNLLQSDKQEPGGKIPKRLGYILIVGLIGLLLLITSNIFSSENNPSPTVSNVAVETADKSKETFSKKSGGNTSDIQEIQNSYEKELAAMLEKIKGVSEVEVMVNLESTKVKVYEKNLITGQQSTEETDKNGGTREIEENTKETQVVLVRQGDKEVPLLIQTKKPEVRGVFVVAKGVDHATVKKWVIDAISRVLDVPTHRVSVMPKN